MSRELFRYTNDPDPFPEVGRGPDRTDDAVYVVDHERQGEPSPETFATLAQTIAKTSDVVIATADTDSVRAQAEDATDALEATMQRLIDSRDEGFSDGDRAALAQGDLTVLPEVGRDE